MAQNMTIKEVVRRHTFHGNKEEHIAEQGMQDILCLDERESTQLAYAVQWLVRDLGFPPAEVNRAFTESFAFFIKSA
jgi:hypothetical protein